MSSPTKRTLKIQLRDVCNTNRNLIGDVDRLRSRNSRALQLLIRQRSLISLLRKIYIPVHTGTDADTTLLLLINREESEINSLIQEV